MLLPVASSSVSLFLSFSGSASVSFIVILGVLGAACMVHALA